MGGDTDNDIIIGLLRFWANNEGKKAPKISKNWPEMSKSK
jgi:hypothetical protein